MAGGKIRIEYDSLRAFMAASTSRLSADGILLPVDPPPGVGARVDFEIALKDGMRLLEGGGVAVWNRSGGDEPAEVAVRFTELSESGRTLVDKIVDQHAREGAPPLVLEPRPLGSRLHTLTVPVGEAGEQEAAGGPGGAVTAGGGDVFDLAAARAPAEPEAFDAPLAPPPPIASAPAGPEPGPESGESELRPIDAEPPATAEDEELPVTAEDEELPVTAADEGMPVMPAGDEVPLSPDDDGEVPEPLADEAPAPAVEPDLEADDDSVEDPALPVEAPAPAPQEPAAEEAGATADELSDLFGGSPPTDRPLQDAFPPSFLNEVEAELSTPGEVPPASLGAVAEPPPPAATPGGADEPTITVVDGGEPGRLEPLGEVPVSELLEMPDDDEETLFPPRPAEEAEAVEAGLASGAEPAPEPVAAPPVAAPPVSPPPAAPAVAVETSTRVAPLVPPPPVVPPDVEMPDLPIAGAPAVGAASKPGRSRRGWAVALIVVLAVALVAAGVLLFRNLVGAPAATTAAAEPVAAVAPPPSDSIEAPGPEESGGDPVEPPAPGAAEAVPPPAAAPEPDGVPGPSEPPQGEPGTTTAGAGAPAEPAAPIPPAGEPAAEPFTGIDRIDVRREGGATVLSVVADGRIGSRQIDRLRLDSGPPREVVKISGVSRPLRPATVEIGGPHVVRVRSGLHELAEGRQLHLVLDLASPAVRVESIAVRGRTIEIRVGGGA